MVKQFFFSLIEYDPAYRSCDSRHVTDKLTKLGEVALLVFLTSVLGFKVNNVFFADMSLGSPSYTVTPTAVLGKFDAVFKVSQPFVEFLVDFEDVRLGCFMLAGGFHLMFSQSYDIHRSLDYQYRVRSNLGWDRRKFPSPRGRVRAGLE